MKSKTACFTGHRIISGSDLPALMRRLEETIAELVSRGVIYFGSGAALGFDQLAAMSVLKHRELNPAVKLILVLPCRNQDARWRETEQHKYQQLLKAADKVVCLSEHYYNGCMEARNKHLVEHSGFCVAYMTRGQSGTAQTVRFARERGLTVINLSDEKKE